MAGGFFLEEYARWKPVIETKRKRDPDRLHYDEFENLCRRLVRMRRKNSR